MSLSDRLSDRLSGRPALERDASTAAELLDRIAASEAVGDLPVAVVQQLVGGVLRVYANACRSAGAEIPPTGRDAAATDAVVLACALVRAQDLSPFDFALWFSHTAPRRDAAGPEPEPRRC